MHKSKNSKRNGFDGIVDQRLVQFIGLVDYCLRKGIGFDRFFVDYIDAQGKRVYWNPFWSYGPGYSPAELFMQLRIEGFGFVPEAAVNVFWQLREQYLMNGS